MQILEQVAMVAHSHFQSSHEDANLSLLRREFPSDDY